MYEYDLSSNQLKWLENEYNEYKDRIIAEDRR